MTDHYPVLDAPYTAANSELCRIVLDELGAIDPHIDETDSVCTIPLRLVHHSACGVHLELGPYSLSELDIESLRAALTAYDQATGPDSQTLGVHR
jgi:hypothetical protein